MYLVDPLSRCSMKETWRNFLFHEDVCMADLVAMSPEKYQELQEATTPDPDLDRLKRLVRLEITKHLKKR